MSIPFIPRPYQQIAMDHIHEHARGGLFAGMGMGKTASTIMAKLDESLVRDIFPVLIVAPLRVANSTWPDELAKWDQFSGLRISCITGSEKERIAALNKKAEFYTINYENLTWLFDHLGGRWPFKEVVLDESTRVKGFRLRQGTKRSSALGAVAHRRCKHWLNLTGTPSPNGLKDLWGQTWFLDEGKRLGRTHGAFTSRWFQKDWSGFGLKPLPHAQDQISAAINDICLSINAKDWFDIKEPIVHNIMVELPPKARAAYRTMEKQLYADLEGQTVEVFNAAAKTQKCLQIANGAAYPEPGAPWVEVHDAKLQALEGVIEEAAGMPVLVSYNFVSDRERILRTFKQARHLDKDPQTIRDWNAGKIPILVAHPKSAGHGLNLADGGNILAFFGHDWDLELYQQIIERIGPTRQIQAGYDRPMFIYNIIARDTIDEVVIERRQNKAEIQDILLASLKRKINNN